MKNKWLKRGLSSILFISLIILVSPFRKDGGYNTFSKLVYCQQKWSCIHEIGHALDDKHGWISQSKEFSEALEVYILAGSIIGDELSIRILQATYTAPDGYQNTKMEIYAFLYQYSNGDSKNLPEIFRKFFDWNEGRNYLNQIEEKRILYLFRRLDK
jgi:hypothetical protein